VKCNLYNGVLSCNTNVNANTNTNPNANANPNPILDQYSIHNK